MPVPRIIYHYTDAIGLKGILSSGRLWLTDIESLNDTSEFRYATRRGFARLKPLLPHPSQGKTLGEVIARKFQDLRSQRADHYVCAFSRTKNDAGQWRAYADDGQGFVLGFDREQLEGMFIAGKRSPAERAAFRVVHGRTLLDKAVSEMLKPIEGVCLLSAGQANRRTE